VFRRTFGAETAYLLCAPVVRRKDWGALIPMLHVPVVVKGQEHLILMSQMIALPSSSLGPVIGTAVSASDGIVRAVNLLVVGF
jgi:toxin CcdB